MTRAGRGAAWLAAEIREAAAAAERWEAATQAIRTMPDDELAEACLEQEALATRLEALVAEAEAVQPPDGALLATAHHARLRARHGAVWARWVQHDRLPPTNLADLA